MSGQEIHFQVGDTLQMQPAAEKNKRYGAQLIGYFADKGLIVKTPHVKGKPLIVRDGQVYIVRVLKEECVYGFKANVLKSYAKPYPHLHLSYPREVTSVVVRSSQRVKMELPSIVKNTTSKDYKKSKASIVDLSLTGSRIRASQQLGISGHHIDVEAKIDIAGEMEKIVVGGIIRNVELSEDDYFHGIQFVTVGRREKLVIHSYVLEATYGKGK